MKSTTPRHRATGFTLIELLIVVAILGILMGLLLPAIAVAKGAARSATCQSNLRQLMLGTYGYADDYHGTLPPVRDSDYKTHWFQFVAPYLEVSTAGSSDGQRATMATVHKTRSVLWGCPDWQGSIQGNGATALYAPGYGMNLYLDRPNSWRYWAPGGGWGGGPITPFMIDQLEHSTQRILLGDANNYAITPPWSAPYKDVQMPPIGTSINQTDWKPIGQRHGSARGNFAFGDGHIESVSLRQALVAIQDPGSL
ncbi:MAG: DUF1559 domain-containing protein [Planctomycetota bacterium]|jgi:prepilin-type N-terminal cleavage/methylation domain-containing protein/prepilin-type processing-associated H-X9-DG protein|nr:DUF1559 domain-containing protein [Planctomycetota bacterium]